MFETSRQLGRIPVVAVHGENAVEHTAWLKGLLRHPLMRGSVVLSPRVQRDIELEYSRVEPFVLVRPTTEEACLCCGMNSGLGDALRSLFLRVLSKRAAPVDRVVIDAIGLDIEQTAFTLKHAPFLGQRYAYQLALTVHGARAVLNHPVSAKSDQFVDFDETSILKLV